MKSVIRLLVVLAVVGSGFGCADGSKIATILPVEGSTEAKPAADIGTAPVSKGSDEIIAPKSETPPAPVASPEPSTPPAPVKPEEKKPEEKKPIVLEKPIDVVKLPPYLVEPITAPITLLAPKKVMSLTDLHSVECVNCSGSDGATHEFRCPSNYVVTGFSYGADEFFGLQVVGGLRIVCSRLDQDHVKVEESALASYLFSDPETAILKGVNHAGKEYELDSAVNCPITDGVATGIFGRAGDRLDSFGLTCGLYLNNDTFTGVFPAAKETLTGEESVYGGTPGNGGAPFDATCDVNEVIVGLSIASGDQVDGISSITCAKVALVDAE